MPADPLTDSDEDRDAARLSDLATNRWYLDAVLGGGYPNEMVELYERLVGALDFIEPRDSAVIGAPSDLLGINYYHRRLVATQLVVEVAAQQASAALATQLLIEILRPVPAPPERPGENASFSADVARVSRASAGTARKLGVSVAGTFTRAGKAVANFF